MTDMTAVLSHPLEEPIDGGPRADQYSRSTALIPSCQSKAAMGHP